MAKKTKDITDIKGAIRLILPDGSMKSFKSSEEALSWFNENYSDKVMILSDEESIKDRKGPIKLNDKTPEEKYRADDKKAMSNPANPYDAATTWIGSNYALASGALGLATAPTTTTLAMVGDAAGQMIGNRASDYVYENPDKGILINEDTSITPRQATLAALGVAGGAGGGYLGKWGTTSRLVATGGESEVYSKPFDKYVYKHSTIPPEEMNIRNDIPGFLKSEYVGLTPDGLYIYRLLKAILPKNPSVAYLKLRLLWADNHYFPFEHDNMQGLGFLNLPKNLVLSDFGDLGTGQIGWTFGRKGYIPTFIPVAIDGAVEPIDEFMMLMEKKGGKLNTKSFRKSK